jgi:hypothetical protein
MVPSKAPLCLGWISLNGSSVSDAPAIPYYVTLDGFPGAKPIDTAAALL